MSVDKGSACLINNSNVNSRRVFTMKRKLVSLVLATAMVTSSMMAMPVMIWHWEQLMH